MAKLSPEETRSLAALASAMKNDSAEAQAKLEEMLSTQDRGLRKLEKQFKKLRVVNIKEIRKQKKALKELLDNWNDISDAKKREVPQLKKSIEEYENANTAINKLAASTKKTTGAIDSLSEVFGVQLKSLSRYMSVLGAFTLAVQGLKKLYETWADLQQTITTGMGQATQALGGTARQMQQFQQRASRLRDTFSHLEGSVDGWAMSMQHLQEASLALRRNADNLGTGVEQSLLRMGRGFGIGTENAGELFLLLRTGIDESNSSLDEFGADMIHFAESIGGNASQLISDFVGARDSVAQFGREGVDTFRNAAMMANEFGFETRRIFQMMRGFDTFSQASQNVNQLNALLGTTLSSYELMLEQDPAERLEMIRSQLMASGQDWNSMSRQARQALAQITGESESVLARVFGEGRSLNEIRQEAQRAERQRQEREQNQQSAQQTMANLLNRTSVVWDNIGRIIQRVTIMLSETLEPIFEVIHEEATGLADEFRSWLQTMVQSGQAEQFIRDVASHIRNMAEWLRNINWERLWERTQQTWREWRPLVQAIGSVLMTVFEFARDNPEVVAGIFAANVLMRFLGPLGRIAGIMGPGGILVAGVAALAVGYADSLRNLNRIVERNQELRALASRGLETEAERSERITSGARALSAIRGAGERRGALTGFLGSNVVQGANQISSRVAEGLGFEGFARRMRQINFETRATEEGDYRSLAEAALSAGASPETVSSRLRIAASNSPEEALMIRRSFGIENAENWQATLRERVDAMANDIQGSPEDAIDQLPSTPAGTTSPATQRTEQAEVPVSTQQTYTRQPINVSLQVDSREFARHMTEVAIGERRG